MKKIFNDSVTKGIVTAIVFLVVANFGFVTFSALAAWSGNPYTPGETLSPECSPLNSNCTVSSMPVSLGGTGLSALSAGYIPFGAGTSAFSTSTALYFDSLNARLGIGTTSPYAKLSVGGDVAAQTFTASSLSATSSLRHIKTDYLTSYSGGSNRVITITNAALWIQGSENSIELGGPDNNVHHVGFISTVDEDFMINAGFYCDECNGGRLFVSGGGASPFGDYNGGSLYLEGGPGSGTGIDGYVRVGNSGTPAITLDRDSLYVADKMAVAGQVHFNGNVGFGTTSPWRKLSVTGTVGFDGLGASGGTQTLCLDVNKQVVTNNGACTTSSEIFKHDIRKMSVDALEILKEIDPITYTYNNEERQRLGFSAQNLDEIESRFIDQRDSDDDPLTIDTTGILSVTVKAVKEIYSIVRGFENQVTTEKLCVGEVCVTEDEFRAMVKAARQKSSTPNADVKPSSVNPDISGTPTITPEPVSDTIDEAQEEIKNEQENIETL